MAFNLCVFPPLYLYIYIYILSIRLVKHENKINEKRGTRNNCQQNEKKQQPVRGPINTKATEKRGAKTLMISKKDGTDI